ncbi:unnamed protein product, partial [Dibothriocephalus latus]
MAKAFDSDQGDREFEARMGHHLGLGRNSRSPCAERNTFTDFLQAAVRWLGCDPS